MSRGTRANSRSNVRSSNNTRVIVRAIACVSASRVRAMNSGTARRGGAPPSPVIVVVISLGCWGADGTAGGGGGAPARSVTKAATATAAIMRIPPHVDRAVSSILDHFSDCNHPNHFNHFDHFDHRD